MFKSLKIWFRQWNCARKGHFNRDKKCSFIVSNIHCVYRLELSCYETIFRLKTCSNCGQEISRIEKEETHAYP